jgi:hypothetical protein
MVAAIGPDPPAPYEVGGANLVERFVDADAENAVFFIPRSARPCDV